MKKVLTFVGILILMIIGLSGLIVGLAISVYYYPLYTLLGIFSFPVVFLGVMITKEVYDKIYPQADYQKEITDKLNEMLKENENEAKG